MATDPRAEANAYLRSHGIKELFADLGARLMFERPKDPNQFLLEELERVQDNRTGPCDLGVPSWGGGVTSLA